MIKYASLIFLVIGIAVLAQDDPVFYGIIPIVISIILDLISREQLVKNIKENKKKIDKLEDLLLNKKSKNKDKDKNSHFEERIEELEISFNKLVKKQENINPREIKERFKDLSEKVNNLANEKLSTNKLEELISRVNSNIKQQIEDFNQLLEKTRPNYELIFDRDGSRKVLLEALKVAQSKIILVCPWVSHGVDSEVIESCEAFLKKGGSIYLGWGHLGDINQKRHISISRAISF